MNTGNIKLFEPTSRMMKSEYPELSQITEFVELNDSEMRFVWYWAAQTSPFVLDGSSDTKEKALNCLRASGLINKIAPEEKADYQNQRFPAKIIKAVNVMASFQPHVRARSKKLLESMLSNLEFMAHINPEEMAIMDIASKREYSQFVKNTANVLSDLISGVENAFGIKEVKVTATDGPSLMDRAIAESDNDINDI
jgi:hypothetical protein